MKLSTTPVSDLDTLPIIMTMEELAPLYRLSASTIRRQVQQGTFSPRPWEKYPYRWRREDVIADLKRGRPERPRRPHGFATTRLRTPVKATLDAGRRVKADIESVTPANKPLSGRGRPARLAR